MANDSSKTGRLTETLWSVLMLICIGLVVLHLANAVRAERAPDETLIQRTFTSADTGTEP
jgi:hypothetical protein